MNILEIIESFVDYVTDSEPVVDDGLNILITHLDKLALSTADINYIFDETEYPEAPDKNYNLMREKISKKFPTLGYYNIASDVSEKIAETELIVGDAIDDISDITGDLEEVIWCYKNTSENNALWHYQNNFTYHWGRHLRDLQLYLHDKSY